MLRVPSSKVMWFSVTLIQLAIVPSTRSALLLATSTPSRRTHGPSRSADRER
jgi:hypothetical protein